MSRNTREYEPIGEASCQRLDLNLEDIHCDIQGFKTSPTRSFLYHFFSVALLGVPYVIFSWFSRLKSVRYRKCSLKQANVVLSEVMSSILGPL
jgi:hypothetical protein